MFSNLNFYVQFLSIAFWATYFLITGHEIKLYRTATNSTHYQESLQNQVFLGDEEYVNQILSDIDQNKDLSEIPKSQRKEKAKELAWYEKQAMSRNEAIKHSYESGEYSMKEIGAYYSLHYSRVSRIIKIAKDKT